MDGQRMIDIDESDLKTFSVVICEFYKYFENYMFFSKFKMIVVVANDNAELGQKYNVWIQNPLDLCSKLSFIHMENLVNDFVKTSKVDLERAGITHFCHDKFSFIIRQLQIYFMNTFNRLQLLEEGCSKSISYDEIRKNPLKYLFNLSIQNRKFLMEDFKTKILNVQM